jgi:ABC-2 type transport system ATP-binding protein/lipopolysaccharide transport system ATP-binding protein
MWARLGFSVATDVQPEILIVDEILSVGDEAFQRKCYQRIETYKAKGTSILLVSHNMSLVLSMCQRSAWLDHGRLMSIGCVDEVVRNYQESQKN